MSHSAEDSTPDTTPKGHLEHWRGMKRILVATDGSPSGSRSISPPRATRS
jgi:hypothetical protein